MRKLPPHPARRAVIVYGVLGLVGVLVAASSAIAAGVAGIPGAAVMLAGSGLFFWLGRYVRTNIRVVQTNNMAYDLMTRGSLDEADAMLRPVAAGLSWGSPARAVHIQRGLIALHRGDTRDAIACLTRALDARTIFLTRRHELTQIPSAHALRAVAHAMEGDVVAAEADARAAEAGEARTPDAVARARLARTILHAREDRREALAEDLRALRTLKDSLTPRERALIRAFERMARSEKRSIYREPAPVIEARSADGLAAWVERVAPAAAGFVREPAPAEAAEPWDERPTREGAARLERTRADAARARPAARNLRAKTLALWVILIVMLLAVWQFLSPSGPPIEGATDPEGSADALMSTLLTTFPPAILLLFTFVVVRTTRAGAREDAELRRIALVAASGQTEEAILLARGAVKTRLGAQAAAAHLALAQLLERKGDFHASAAEAQAGIARANVRGVKVAVSDILLPELIATRAFALAVDGEVAESVAETDDLARSYPAFPYRARALLRVRIARALARRDFPAAARVARTRTPELPVSVRDEVLCDLLDLWADDHAGGAAGGPGEEERARVLAALEDDRELAPWVERVAPGLAADVARKVRVAVITPDAERDEEDTEDALASADPRAGRMQS